MNISFFNWKIQRGKKMEDQIQESDENLFMGSLNKNGNNSPFTIVPKELKSHIFITGQSGYGKSNLTSRLLEEILLKNAGRIFLLDYNKEFSKFIKVNSAMFKEDWNKKNCSHDQKNVFKNSWNVLNDDNAFEIVCSNSHKIIYNQIPTNLKALLYSAYDKEDAGLFWLLRFIDETDYLKNMATSLEGFNRLIKTINRWYENRLDEKEFEFQGLVNQLKQHVSKLDVTKFMNVANDLSNTEGESSYVSFGNNGSTANQIKNINGELFEKLLNKLKFCSLDMLNFKYKDYPKRDFVAFYALNNLWELSKDRFRDSKENGGDGKVAEEDVIYIVIDEAHNIIPKGNNFSSQTAEKTAGLIKTIAAEGRKFGLFLILISQRPNKINEDVLSECDTFIVMRSTPSTIKSLKDNMPMNGNDKKLLDKAISFSHGEALYYARFTNYSAKIVQGDIKRTM